MKKLDGFDWDRAMKDAIVIPTEDGTNRVRACQKEALYRGKRLFSVQRGTECRVIRDGDDEATATTYGPAPILGVETCSTNDAEGLNTGGMANPIAGNNAMAVSISLLTQTIFGMHSNSIHLCWCVSVCVGGRTRDQVAI